MSIILKQLNTNSSDSNELSKNRKGKKKALEVLSNLKLFSILCIVSVPTNHVHKYNIGKHELLSPLQEDMRYFFCSYERLTGLQKLVFPSNFFALCLNNFLTC